MRLSARAEVVTHDIAKRSQAEADADIAWKMAHARAILRAVGATVGEREAKALLECEDEYRAKRESEAVLLATQEAGRNVRAQLEALRSVNANIRAVTVGA